MLRMSIGDTLLLFTENPTSNYIVAFFRLHCGEHWHILAGNDPDIPYKLPNGVPVCEILLLFNSDDCVIEPS